jgi:V8-like Glu-specific endopeptidase
MPVGCTAWLFDGKPNAMLSAGHCFDGTVATVVQFNVPASSAGGAPQNPPPSDQYAIDPASVQFANTVIGNDWGHFGVFSNSTTGLSPLVAQGGTSFARTAPVAGGNIRITGFGVDSFGPANQTNQTHFGPFDSLTGTIIRYQADTTGGNSGSPIIREATGQAMGIHTNAGCFNNGGGVGGANQGTTFGNAGVLNAIANPLGVAAATTACGASGESCFTAHSTPHCNDAACCTTVCAADPFCCNTSWDNLCVTRAWDLCRNCGPGSGSCYSTHGPGCEDISCCSSVCTADPFCCDTAWDSLCVQRAEASCRSGITCEEAKLLTVAVPATLSFSTLDDPSGSDDSTCGDGDVYAVWRRYVPECSGMSTITICSNDAVQPTVAVFSSCGGTQLACSASAAPCGANAGASVEFATLAGQSYYIRISAINGLDTTGTIATMCEAVCGSGPSCTVVHGTPGCSDASCCVNVCTVDPYCCNVQWDSLCVGGAQDLCFRDGDLNYDGVVNAADLGILLNGWGGSGVSDINGDGTTNAADLAVMLSNWG